MKCNDLIVLYAAKPDGRRLVGKIACVHSVDEKGVVTVQHGAKYAPGAYRLATLEDVSEAYKTLRTGYERVCDELDEVTAR